MRERPDDLREARRPVRAIQPEMVGLPHLRAVVSLMVYVWSDCRSVAAW